MTYALNFAVDAEMISVVVEYIDARTEARRTAVVTIPENHPELIPFRLHDAGRKIKRILFYHLEDSPGEKIAWT